MAVYKVPQDVEAEDKLIGPFSFRQFIYLVVAAIGMLLAWALGRVFVGLIIIPLPIIAFFLIIALPLRKDQPMETYLAAVVRFFLKPRRRLWVPEGTISLVNIVSPKIAEPQLTKGFSGEEASARLSFLAQVVDTQGWSTRGVATISQTMNDIAAAEAQAVEDVLDENTEVAQALEQRIAQSDEARKQAMVQQFQQAIQGPATQQSPVAPTDQPVYAPTTDDTPQVGTTPLQEAANAPAPMTLGIDQKPAEQPGAQTVSPDIMRLANNNDLSISTLANEAHRLQNEEEVEISLR